MDEELNEMMNAEEQKRKIWLVIKINSNISAEIIMAEKDCFVLVVNPKY